jgi:hypothetical protein
MHLVEILLPVYDNDGRPFPRADFGRVRSELAERFGGVTAFSRAPAEGFWKDEEGATARDDVVIFEVMSDQLDRAWWATYREQLRQRFRQEELVVRATHSERL